MINEIATDSIAEPAVSARPKWRTPTLSREAITDFTNTIIAAPGIDNYESSSPADGS